jgi:hypothetical protein
VDTPLNFDYYKNRIALYVSDYDINFYDDKVVNVDNLPLF